MEPAPDGPDRAWLQQRWQADPAQRAIDAQRLQAALGELHAAPISTLHALCARILADHPFAAGALFRAREMTDGTRLRQTLADDLWRVIAQGDAQDELVRLAQAAGMSRGRLLKYLPVLQQPDVVMRGEFAGAVLAALQGVVGDLSAWRAALGAVLAEAGLLRSGGKLQKAWLALAAGLELDDDALIQALADHLDALREAPSLKGVNGAGQAHPGVLRLVDQSAAIAAALPPVALDMASHQPLRRFLEAAQRWCQAAMRARLEAANQSTFDQLLHTVRDALEPRDGACALADALFAAWPVALVDEFQDTDPVQFGILDAIYRDDQGRPRGRLVMIGDPKQAIYRFRGGDIEAYERACAAVPEGDRLTLGTNHRSSRTFVAALNSFYAATGSRLGPPESKTGIHYQPVLPSSRRDAEPLRDARSGDAVARPLVIHELMEGEATAALQDTALRACAGQIVQALSPDGYCIGARALQPGDIAVLLPSHAQIASLAAMLKARGVPCVVAAQGNVFDTATARELRLILHAALHPGESRSLRAALVTRLWGESLAGLQALEHDAAAWDARAGAFRRLHDELVWRGPLAVVNHVLTRHAARLLDTVAGERVLTDLRHLGELLQAAWETCGGGERLMAWFADQARGDTDSSDAGDARALRLESDAARVRLMTLHASKGLEFGVVFLPLMWKHGRFPGAGSAPHLLSDAGSAGKLLVEGPAREPVVLQEFEERYRVLYVAVTRAIYACHVFALGPGVEKKPRDAPLNTLDLGGLWAAGAPGVAHRSGWDACPAATWRSPGDALHERVARALPAAPAGPLPQRHSFSSLLGHASLAEEGSAADEDLLASAAVIGIEAETAEVAEPTSLTWHRELDDLAVVAGADFGNAVHDIFEHRQPGVCLTAQQNAVRGALMAHGVRPREGDLEVLVEPLAARLQGTLEARLGSADGPRLIDLQPADMRAEMEFNYRLDGASLRALREACEAHGEHDLVPRREQTLAGLMNGKIDLVFAHGGRFHLLDYKSNDLALGTRPYLEHYAPAALGAAMQRNGYRFQALLYAVALERYLRERLDGDYRRERHLGDAWYLFVRATGLALPDGTPCGTWRHRFDGALLDAVQAVLGADTRGIA